MNTLLAETSPFMTFADAMAYLKVSRCTLYRPMEAGTLSGYKVGSTWRFLPEDVKACVRLEPVSKIQGPKCACGKDYSACDYPDC